MTTEMRTLYPLIPVLALAILAGCRQEAAVTPAITPDAASATAFAGGLQVGSEAGTYPVSFNTTVDWALKMDETRAVPTWVSVSAHTGKAGDNTVVLTVRENPSLDSRAALFTVSAESVQKTFSLVQSGRPPIALQQIALDKTEMSLYLDETGRLSYTLTPDNADGNVVTWVSDNPAIATVADGVVQPVAVGQTVVAAEASGKRAECTVTVLRRYVPVTSVVITPATLEIKEGETATLVATLLPEDSDLRAATWTSSDPSVVTVQNGVVTAVAPGTAVITAKADDASGTCTVTVLKKGNTGDDLGHEESDPWK